MSWIFHSPVAGGVHGDLVGPAQQHPPPPVGADLHRARVGARVGDGHLGEGAGGRVQPVHAVREHPRDHDVPFRIHRHVVGEILRRRVVELGEHGAAQQLRGDGRWSRGTAVDARGQPLRRAGGLARGGDHGEAGVRPGEPHHAPHGGLPLRPRPRRAAWQGDALVEDVAAGAVQREAALLLPLRQQCQVRGGRRLHRLISDHEITRCGRSAQRHATDGRGRMAGAAGCHIVLAHGEIGDGVASARIGQHGDGGVAARPPRGDQGAGQGRSLDGGDAAGQLRGGGPWRASRAEEHGGERGEDGGETGHGSVSTVRFGCATVAEGAAGRTRFVTSRGNGGTRCGISRRGSGRAVGGGGRRV